MGTCYDRSVDPFGRNSVERAVVQMDVRDGFPIVGERSSPFA